MNFDWPSQEIVWAICCALLPVPLLIGLGKISIAKEASRRFLLACIATLAIYGIILALLVGPTISIQQAVLGVGAIGVSPIVTLGLWGVLTRGYSLSLLLTLLELNGTGTRFDIERSYSGGRGLRWLMRKRLLSLERTHAITIRKDAVWLRSEGKALLSIYRAGLKMFSLKQFG